MIPVDQAHDLACVTASEIAVDLAQPFAAARFLRLPPAAQLAALPLLADSEIDVCELIATLEERPS